MIKRFISICVFVSMLIATTLIAHAQILPVPEGVGVKSIEQCYDSQGGYYYILLSNDELWKFEIETDETYSGKLNIAGVSKVSDNVKELGYRSGYNIFYVKTDNTLWGWGKNEDYELGLGHNNEVLEPTKIMDDVLNVYPSQYYNTYVIKTDNSMWGWGLNGHGQLGNGTTDASYTPIKMYDNVVKIIQASNSVFFLTQDKKVYGNGDIYGMSVPTVIYMGDKFPEQRYTPHLMLEDVEDFFVDTYPQFFYLRTDGSIWGFTAKEKDYYPWIRTITKLFDSDLNIINIDSFGRTTYFIYKADGSLWVKGDNTGSNHLGVNDKSELTDFVKVLDNVEWADLSSSSVSYVITNSGDLYGWGLGNRRLNRVDQSLTEEVYETPVKLRENIKAFYSDSVDTFYIYNDGSLYVEYWYTQYDANNNRTTIYEKAELVGPTVNSPAVTTNIATTKVLFNDDELNLSNPINRNNRSYYPFRTLLEAVRAKVDWRSETNTAIGVFAGHQVEFTINSNVYSIDGATHYMDEGVTAFIEDGNTYIPLRYALEGLGFTVDFDNQTNTIIISD